VGTDVSRRRFLATSVATSGSIDAIPSLGRTRAPLQTDQARGRLVDELMARLGMSKSNAEAMAMRAARSIDRPGAILLGNASGAEVEVVEWERRQRKWVLRGEPRCHPRKCRWTRDDWSGGANRQSKRLAALDVLLPLWRRRWPRTASCPRPYFPSHGRRQPVDAPPS
jgi:hypothetical protein